MRGVDRCARARSRKAQRRGGKGGGRVAEEGAEAAVGWAEPAAAMSAPSANSQLHRLEATCQTAKEPVPLGVGAGCLSRIELSYPPRPHRTDLHPRRTRCRNWDDHRRHDAMMVGVGRQTSARHRPEIRTLTRKRFATRECCLCCSRGGVPWAK